MSFRLKSLWMWGLVVLGVSVLFAVNPVGINAQSKNYSIDRLDVVITINPDSTVNVTEKLSYTFDDQMNGMFREITLEDRDSIERCQENPNLQCGGFEFIHIDQVLVNGEEVREGRYETFKITSSAEERLRVQYEFDGAPVFLSNESYTFQVDYTVLGSIGFFENEGYALFYWDAIFADRDRAIGDTRVQINYPGSIATDRESSRVLASSVINYDQRLDGDDTVIYEVEDIPPYFDFTVLQKINLEDISRPAEVNLSLSPASQMMSFGGFELKVADGESVVGIPSGEIEIAFSESNYYDKSVTLDASPGDIIDLKVELERTPLGMAILAGIVIGNLLCCCLTIFAPVALYLLWFRRGRDKGNGKSVIPEFAPPDGMKPYLLGSLKDEVVDNKDISASIIDLAYRGHILIVEGKKPMFGSRDFTLEKQVSGDELDNIEEQIMDMLFASGNSVKLSALRYKAYTKMDGIKSDVYKQMVNKGYFKKNPNSERNAWLVGGIITLVVGIGLSVGLVFLGILTGFLAAIALGVGLIVVSRVMPSKTELGAETLRNIRGFKMYLGTAEKHTLQNLTPDLFEKFLAYAIVFGVEEKWAKSFSGIYNEAPSWYQGRGGVLDAVLLSRMLNDFTSVSSSNVTAKPSSSSSSGSGWSGSGGFSGGFSGGGGGGGGGGAW